MLDNDFSAVGIHEGSVYFRGKQTAKDHASARVSEAFLCGSTNITLKLFNLSGVLPRQEPYLTHNRITRGKPMGVG